MKNKTKTSESTSKGQKAETPQHRGTEAPKHRDTGVPQHSSASLQHSITPVPRYSLKKGLGFWDLTFDGQHATIKHDQGLAYVAYLLTNPPAEAIHALDLATRIAVINGKHVGITEIVDPKTGFKAYLDAFARVEERSPALDDALAMRQVIRQQHDLEEMIEQEDTIDPVKEEALRELIVLYNYEDKHSKRVLDSAQKAAHAVRTAIKRFYRKLSIACQADGTPNQVLRAFAAHIDQYLLGPSTPRYGRIGRRIRVGSPGCFTYQPPTGVVWSE
jgi:hypothetical protein